MLLGELRKVLADRLESFFRIDEWGLGLPASVQNSNNPPSIGLDKPALDLVFDKEGVGYGEEHHRYVSTTIPFRIMYRFDSTYKYRTLPRVAAEDSICQFILNLLATECLHNCIEEVKPSGSVSVAETKNGDWLLIVEIDFFIKFYASQNHELSNTFINE